MSGETEDELFYIGQEDIGSLMALHKMTILKSYANQENKDELDGAFFKLETAMKSYLAL